MQPASNPYAIIPTIGKVLQALWDMAETVGQQTFQISNRRLAAAAGCSSASGMPTILRQLAADGHISYDPSASMVMILGPSIDEMIDHSTDRVSPPPARPGATSRCRSDLLKDRVKTHCMDHESHESLESVSEARDRAVSPFPDDPEWPQWEALGVYPEAYPDLRRDFPQVSLAQFSFWCSQLQSKRSPAGFVIYSLKNHLPLPRQRTQAPPPIEAKRTRGRRVPASPQMPPPPTADEEARNAAAWQQVAEICPPGASDLDQVELVSDLLDGFSADQALARLASRRQAAAP